MTADIYADMINRCRKHLRNDSDSTTRDLMDKYLGENHCCDQLTRLPPHRPSLLGDSA